MNVNVRFAVVVSEKDLAGMNIKEQLLKLNNKLRTATPSKDEIYETCETEYYKLITIKQDSIHADNIDRRINADCLIFATKHKAESGIPCLTVHVPGNWGKAEMGGKEKTLCIAPASLIKLLFLGLKKEAKEQLGNYEVVLECTHHGPYLEKPACFIEIGSTEKEWRDERLGRVIAETINNVLSNALNLVRGCKSVFCIGSTHYPEKFTRFLLETEYAVGHICPKYAIGHLDEEIFRQALEKTQEKVVAVVLDKKIKSGDRKRIIRYAERVGLKLLRV